MGQKITKKKIMEQKKEYNRHGPLKTLKFAETHDDTQHFASLVLMRVI